MLYDQTLAVTITIAQILTKSQTKTVLHPIGRPDQNQQNMTLLAIMCQISKLESSQYTSKLVALSGQVPLLTLSGQNPATRAEENGNAENLPLAISLPLSNN